MEMASSLILFYQKLNGPYNVVDVFGKVWAD